MYNKRCIAFGSRHHTPAVYYVQQYPLTRNKNKKSAFFIKAAYALDSGTRSGRAAGSTIRLQLKNLAHGSHAQQPSPTTKFQLEKQNSRRTRTASPFHYQRTALATTVESPRTASSSSARTRTARRVTRKPCPSRLKRDRLTFYCQTTALATAAESPRALNLGDCTTT
ncbi:hypothetical protein EXIGLDRAFT_174402 [Exidia glandulosa HHB12029]|uniref:Uncharacterized protein n=1 Tax=Exidia glandulosa HHB12029 TaxID=1314781 RepID=A0A165F8I1_EXIGL|nr:hypothetical protein EXIGLDRAFT_174402 [Exidia glandulosa HHB12029]